VTPDLCEWNPVLKRPALHQPLGTPVDDGSCGNLAELILGANGKWRVCRSCYESERHGEFWRYRAIIEIRHPEEASNG
jgi:hypothetical protein